MRRWILAGLLALAGLGVTFPLFQRDASSHWRFQAGREELVERARELARFHGVNTAGWSAQCRAEIPSWRVRFAAVRRRPPHPLITTAQPEVMFLAPDGGRSIFVKMTSDGRPLGFEIRHRPGDRLRRVDAPARVADEVLARYAREFARSFQVENAGIRQGNESVYSWTWGSPSAMEVSVRLEVTFEDGALSRSRLIPSFPAEFMKRDEANRSRSVILVAVMAVAIAVTFFVAFPIFFRGLVRRWFPRSRLWPLAVLSLAVVLMGSMAGSWWVDQSFSAGLQLTTVWSKVTGPLIALLLLAIPPVVFYGAGRSMIRPAELVRWRGFELLLDGRWWSRPVGEGLAGGVLAGCALVALPLLAGAPIPPALPFTVDDGLAFSAAPWATFLRGAMGQEVAGLFLLWWPVCQWFKRAVLGWLGFGVMGVVVLAGLRDTYSAWPGLEITSSSLLLVGFVLSYRAFGLLGVTVAAMTQPAVYHALALGLQPAAAMRANIPIVLAGPALMLMGGAIIAWRGREVNAAKEIERELDSLVEAGSDRDRLKAEFNVARKAQIGMLPDLPPQVDGLALAGSCVPAREVGGDLFDFFSCADGRYGFCVADVSGKGVPASLYMAMTKGLIASAIHDTSDPGQVLSWLNRHWLDHGKRKMFCTMAMCFYDPKTRSLEYVRAGHNPVVVWQKGEGRLVAPGGVGLGLAAVKQFDRTLRRETITLGPGDLVVMYSDGIVEAMNVDHEQFGEERLMDAVRDCQDYSAQETEQEIARRVRLFMGAAPPHDDMTLLVLRAL